MWCQLDDLPVYYETAGDGHPLVFLHGWGGGHLSEAGAYEPVLTGRGGWQRIYLDVPGRGQTPSRPWIRSQDDLLDVVLRFLDEVLPGRRFALAGTSAGGYLARGVVHHRPDAVEGLLLRVPAVVMDSSRRTLPPFRPLLEDPELMASLDETDAGMLGEALVQRPEYLAAARRARAAYRRAEAGADLEFLEAIRNDPERYEFTFDVDALPEPFGAPTLIIAGRQDTVVGYRDVWSIVEHYPRATLAVLDRAGHDLPIDQDALFHALVTEWLDRVEEARDGANR